MNNFLIFISLTLFSFCGYVVWPSRYNVITHGTVAAGFISIIVPSVVLNIPDRYPEAIVDLYTRILVVGILFFLPGFIGGFLSGRRWITSFSFDVMETAAYENRVIRITRNLLIAGIVGLTISYSVMGFLPIFAREPIAAKLFRGPYQAPYLRVAVLFRVSFFLLSTIMPIACIIWYKIRTRLFLWLVISGIWLMIASLQRAGAFSGIVFAAILIMSFKSRTQFTILMVLLVGIFVMSSFFYYIVGIKTFKGDENVWEVIGASAPDIDDQLNFMEKFDQTRFIHTAKPCMAG